LKLFRMASQIVGLDGERTSGQEVRTNNVTACMAISNILKSSLGPTGLDKMLVDEIGELTITNDGATILQKLEVEHPAAKVLVELAELQDSEVGDGTTSVVIIAAELLKRGNELVKNGIHPTTVMSGYRLALKEAVKYIKSTLMIQTHVLGESAVAKAAATSLASKVLNAEPEFWSKLAVKAVKAVKTQTIDGKSRYPVSAIHILKAHGKSSMESELIADGFALNVTRAAQGMPNFIRNAKIAMLDFPLQRHKVSTGVSVEVAVNEVEGVRRREMDITKERIAKMIEAGANVILTTKGIDDACLKYFVEAGAIAARRVKKEDLTRLARATNGSLVSTLADLEGNETFDPNQLGTADLVAEERVGDGEMLYIRGCSGARAATVVLRGANEYHLDELDRALHDVFMIVKRVLESAAVVAGGGAVEAALSVYLDNFAHSLGSREQLAVAEFAQALLVIPRTLAVNAASDAIDLVATLRAHHARALALQDETNTSPPTTTNIVVTTPTPTGGDQTTINTENTIPPVPGSIKKDLEEEKGLKYTGLDLTQCTTRNNLNAGILEPAISKIKCLRFATEAAITILRIDDSIRINPKPPPEDPRRRRG